MFDIARLEVLRGPQGTLYGRNTTGGAVNIITNAPTADRHAGLTAEYGSYDRYKVEGFVSGQIVPGLLGRLAAVTELGGAWQYHRTTGQKLGERGHEFGTVTGRKRRCGWFDAVLVRQSCAISGVTGIALTKLDVLDGFEKVKICTGYRLGGKVLDYFPSHAAGQADVEPIY